MSVNPYEATKTHSQTTRKLNRRKRRELKAVLSGLLYALLSSGIFLLFSSGSSLLTPWIKLGLVALMAPFVVAVVLADKMGLSVVLTYIVGFVSACVAGWLAARFFIYKQKSDDANHHLGD